MLLWEQTRIFAKNILHYEEVPNRNSLFYQSGYLTIKDYDRTFQTYTLGYPNEEVKVGLTQMLIPYYVSTDINKTNTACRQICKALMGDDIDAALTAAQAFFAGIRKLEDRCPVRRCWDLSENF